MQMLALPDRFTQEKKTLLALLPSAIDRERWGQFVLAALKSPQLQRCTQESVIAALYRNARVGLPLDGVHASLVPFGQECTHIIGFPGYVSLYKKHAGVSHVAAKVVFEDDRFEVTEGTEPLIVHVPNPKGNHTDPEKVIAAYAIAYLKNPDTHAVVMWEDELRALRKRCLERSRGKGPWMTDPIEMFRKSPIIRLRKGLNMNEELQAAIAFEERDELIETESETVASQPLGASAFEQARAGQQPAAVEPVVVHESMAPLAPERWLGGIRIDLIEPFDVWADEKIGGKHPVLSKLTWRQLSIDQTAGLDDMMRPLLDAGSRTQDKDGKSHPMTQKLAIVGEMRIASQEPPKVEETPW